MPELSILQLIAIAYGILYIARLRVTWIESRMAATALEYVGLIESFQIRMRARSLFLQGAVFDILGVAFRALFRPTTLFFTPSWAHVLSAVQKVKNATNN
jgi:hypothetical protein